MTVSEYFSKFYQVVAKLIAEIDSPVQNAVTLFKLNFVYQIKIHQILHISANDPVIRLYLYNRN